MSSEFEKLAAELGLLAKAQKYTEDEKVLASAQEGGVDTDGMADGMADGEGDADADADAGAGAGAGGEGEDADDASLGKSYSMTDASGQSFQGYDATDLLKSLSGRLGGLEQAATDEESRRGHLSKSLVIITHLLQGQDEKIKSQNEAIASLQKSMGEVGRQGVGRRAVLNVTEKPDTMIKSAQPDGIDGRTFMVKAMEALSAGRISGRDVSIAESSLNRGVPVDAGIVNRVMGNQ
jgi:hypothetical protein